MSNSIQAKAWVPKEYAKWLKKVFNGLPKRYREMHTRLATDTRMREAWEWCNEQRTDEVPEWHYDKRMKLLYGWPSDIKDFTAIQFSLKVQSAFSNPGKPSNLPPKQREAYLSKVRKHATILVDLLEGTKFDFGFSSLLFSKVLRPIKPDNLGNMKEDLLNSLAYEANDDGHLWTQTYGMDDGEVYRAPWDYPESELVETLRCLINWTNQDDYFSIMHSCKSIRQSGIRGRKAYFITKLHDDFSRDGTVVPHSIMATIANVALNLATDEEFDEESVRKQIARHTERQGNIEKQDPAF